MKKMMLCLLATVLASSAFAQKNAFINTEQVFRALPEYTAALAEIDTYAQEQQALVDADFVKIAETYERYQEQRQNLTEASRRQVEERIIQMEKEATEKQSAIFGQEGTLMQRRIEKLKPIQDKVFAVVDQIAKAKGCDLVIDISNNPSIIYYNAAGDLTAEVIAALGIKQ
jgi:outer membrane protein